MSDEHGISIEEPEYTISLEETKLFFYIKSLDGTNCRREYFMSMPNLDDMRKAIIPDFYSILGFLV